jgi:asparagine synthase (glutamine-hydrolysing)
MCGIAGILSPSKQIEAAELKLMSDTLVHRGPDNQGIWLNETKIMGLAHQRLVIIDANTNANQPMHFKKYTITYNGEIYNYIEIRKLLQKEGYTFETASDTEVLLKAYDFWGVKCLNEFDGMFAFAIWDETKQELFCARDRLGEKPFYYCVHNRQFYFGSEMKAIFKAGVPKEVNETMMFYYLSFNHLENPYKKNETFFNQIQKLDRANYIIVNKNLEVNKHCYWSINAHQIDNKIKWNEAKEQFIYLLESSIKRRLRADVPIGTSLSGGIDSSCIVALINKIAPSSKYNKTFTARFDSPEVDEGNYAELMAKHVNFEWYQEWPNMDDCLDHADELMYHQEEPFLSPSIYAQWKIYKYSKSQGITVMLDGQGADEVLGGYEKYIPSLVKELYFDNNDQFSSEYNELALNYPINFSPNYTTSLQYHFPKFSAFVTSLMGNYLKEIKATLNPDFYHANKKIKNPYPYFKGLNENLCYDTYTYGLEKLLRIADRNAMANQIEVRLAFLDHKLLEFCFSLPGKYKIGSGYTKLILRESCESLLPSQIAWRIDKKGFQPPTNMWMKSARYKNFIREIHQQKEVKQYVTNNLNDWKVIELYLFLKQAKKR